MKAKLLKFLRLVGYVVPLMVGFIKKLALGLIKKLTSLANWARCHLNRVNQACERIQNVVDCASDPQE